MDKLLFANIDINGTDFERWCRCDKDQSKGTIDKKANVLGSQYERYRAFEVGNGDNYSIAYDKVLKAIVLTQRGSSYSSGFILVASGLELENRHAAGYIGSTTPEWLPVEKKITCRVVEENLNDTTWLKYTATQMASATDIRKKLIPLVFSLLEYKKSSPANRLVFVCDTTEDLQKMADILKSALLALPCCLANQYSFNTNAVADQLYFLDVACMSKEAYKNCDESLKSAIKAAQYPLSAMDESIISSSSFCQYLFEEGIIPQGISPEISTVEELELSVADIRLENYCKKEISCDEVEKAFSLYDAAHKDYIASSPSIIKAFTKLSYVVYFSENYSRNEKFLERIRNYILDSKNMYNDINFSIDENKLTNELIKEQPDEAAKHLSALFSFVSVEEGIPDVPQQAITKLLCGEITNIAQFKPIFLEFIKKLSEQELEKFLQLPCEVKNEKWISIVVDKIIGVAPSNKGLDFYIKIRGEQPKQWLFNSLLKRMKMSSFEDIGIWIAVKNSLVSNAYNDEVSLLEENFIVEFEDFLKSQKFYESADSVIEKITNNHLKQIFDIAKIFKYAKNDFNLQKERIFILNKKADALSVLRDRALMVISKKKKSNKPEKIIQKARMNHFITNIPIILFGILFVQMLFMFFAYYFSADLAIWDILSALTTNLSAATMHIFCIGISMLVCLVIYIGVILSSKQYNSKLTAIRAFEISTLIVFVPLGVFLVTAGVIFH